MPQKLLLINWLETVLALYMYRRNVKARILALPIIIQFIVGSVQIARVSRCPNFHSYCIKPTSLMDVGLTGCVSWYPSHSVSEILCSSRGSVVLAHAVLFVATFAKQSGPEGRAAVGRLVVREGAWIVFSLIGQ